jgi:endogenous inhibitor of DNA gyrase (YacG/DUF329 family)
VRCPECGKECEWEGNPFKPFCSERCKLADLMRWLSEEYMIAEDVQEEEPEAP